MRKKRRRASDRRRATRRMSKGARERNHQYPTIPADAHQYPPLTSHSHPSRPTLALILPQHGASDSMVQRPYHFIRRIMAAMSWSHGSTILSTAHQLLILLWQKSHHAGLQLVRKAIGSTSEESSLPLQWFRCSSARPPFRQFLRLPVQRGWIMQASGHKATEPHGQVIILGGRLIRADLCIRG